MNWGPLPYQGSALPLSYMGLFSCEGRGPRAEEKPPFLATRPSSLGPHCLERVMGIEPTSSAWKAEVLPLNYTRETAGTRAEWRGPRPLVKPSGTSPAASNRFPSGKALRACPKTSSLGPRHSSLFVWWRGEDSNLRRRSRQIYSLIPLATREPLRANEAAYFRRAVTRCQPFVGRKCLIFRGIRPGAGVKNPDPPSGVPGDLVPARGVEPRTY